ncbi:hypothetical protein H9L39_19665 [Fusarium oxysporum f. sp. albedinis]|nr:hypothetical protein H9L39_19665 [Fusarium oxysporum f. sp. albedinis]
MARRPISRDDLPVPIIYAFDVEYDAISSNVTHTSIHMLRSALLELNHKNKKLQESVRYYVPEATCPSGESYATEESRRRRLPRRFHDN